MPVSDEYYCVVALLDAVAADTVYCGRRLIKRTDGLGEFISSFSKRETMLREVIASLS